MMARSRASGRRGQSRCAVCSIHDDCERDKNNQQDFDVYSEHSRRLPDKNDYASSGDREDAWNPPRPKASTREQGKDREQDQQCHAGRMKQYVLQISRIHRHVQISKIHRHPQAITREFNLESDFCKSGVNNLNTTWAIPTHVPRDMTGSNWSKSVPPGKAASRGIYVRCRILRQSRSRHASAHTFRQPPRRHRRR